MPCSIATPLSLSIASASSARSGLILTRPMTARIGLSFQLRAPCMNAHTWITLIPWGHSCAVVMRPQWRSGGRRCIGELTYFWLVLGGASRHERGGLGTPAQAELGQDPRHVMLDRLARKEKTLGDLGA